MGSDPIIFFAKYAALPFPPCQSMLTARAANKPMTKREIMACVIIRIFAQRDSTGVSVGERAVLVVKARNR